MKLHDLKVFASILVALALPFSIFPILPKTLQSSWEFNLLLLGIGAAIDMVVGGRQLRRQYTHDGNE